MYVYPIRKLTAEDIEDLVQQIKQAGMPLHEHLQNGCRVTEFGGEKEYEVTLSGTGSRKEAVICIRYENPALKHLFITWGERRKIKLPQEFFGWHPGLAPSVIAGIRQRWHVDLENLGAIPIRLGKQTLVFTFAENVSANLAAQLGVFPERRLAAGEFIRSTEFSVSGDDPADTSVYFVNDSAGGKRLVAIADTPAMTLLSLWITSTSLESNPAHLARCELS